MSPAPPKAALKIGINRMKMRKKLIRSKKKIKVVPMKEIVRADYKKTLETDWFPKAWKESQQIEAQRKADEIKYLVRRLYEIIF